jgi:hypothetical protein
MMKLLFIVFAIPIALAATTRDLASATLGQNVWCYVPPHSETFYCDHFSYSACHDAHRREIVKAGGTCVIRPRKGAMSDFRMRIVARLRDAKAKEEMAVGVAAYARPVTKCPPGTQGR